ncbi:MAG TPA: hypothetical protein VLZ83_16850 [Edaphocola sp.]|nr:hypothetical protein [Edaphocola sp.]
MKRIVLFTFLVITLSFNSLFAGITISGQVTKAEIKNLPNGDSELTITCSGEGICVSIYPGSDGEILISIPD